ncbi:MAG: hypothetical protein ABIH86_01205, partial [Planctomycetota bacterium]
TYVLMCACVSREISRVTRARDARFGSSLKKRFPNPYGEGSQNRLTCLLCEKLISQIYKYYNKQQDMKSDIANISVKFTNRCEKRDTGLRNSLTEKRYENYSICRLIGI